MKLYGDITKLSGYDLDPVDLIVGGSPCQDLSVAGKREGLEGERSGLFMEMIRVIKEMRPTHEYKETDVDRGSVEPIRLPNYVLWENVPGALSSNSGEDFRCVLEEFARVKDETVVIPRPPKGKWPNAGSIVGNGWSLAWRIRDAQYWGVPQRRRRIALLVDYGGMDAGAILFEQRTGREPRQQVRPIGESMSGDSASGEEEGQGTADDPAGGSRSTGIRRLNPAAYTLKIRGGGGDRLPRKGCGERTADTDGAFGNARSIAGSDAVRECVPIEGNGARASHRGPGFGEAGDPSFTLNSVEKHSIAIDQQGGKGNAMYADELCPSILSDSHGTPHAVAIDVYNQDVAGDVAPSLTAASGLPNTSGPKVMEIYAVDMGAGKSTSGIHREVSPTLATTHYGEPVINDNR